MKTGQTKSITAAIALLAVICAAMIWEFHRDTRPERTWYTNPGREKIIESSRYSDAAPSGFRNRPTLHSCGDVRLVGNDEIPAAALLCLERHWADGSELGVSHRTKRGDWIVSFYRFGPDITGREVYTDLTRDPHSAGGWDYSACTSSVIAAPTAPCHRL